MSRISSALAACLTTLVIAVLARSATAEEKTSFRLERLMPPDSMAFIAVPDVDAAAKVFSRTAISKILRDEEVQEFVAPLLQMLDRKTAELKKEEGVDLADLMSCFRGQVAIGLIDIDDSKGVAKPKIVVAVDARENAAKLLAFIDRGKMKLQRDNERLESSSRKHGGFEISSIVDAGMTMEGTLVGTTYLLTTHPGATNAILDAYKAEAAAKSLADSELWAAAMKPVSGEGVPMLVGYVNLARIFERFKGGIAPVETWLRESGVMGVKAVSFATHLDGPNFVDRIHLHAPGEKRGLFAIASRKPVTPEMLRNVPEEAMYMAAGTMDLAKAWTEVFRVIEVSDKGIYDEAMRGLAEIEKHTGVSIRKEVVDAIGNELILYATAPKGGGPIPEVVLDLQIKDRAAFEKAVTKFLGALVEMEGDSFSFDSLKYRGETIHYLRLEEGIPITPSYAFLGDRLVVSLFPNTIKSLIRRRSADEAPSSILDSKAFREAYAKLPRGSASVEYYDLPTIFELGYNLATPMLLAVGPKIAETIPGLSMAALPSSEAVSQHLTPIAGGGRVDDTGMTMTITSPIGVMPFFATATVASTMLFAGMAVAEPVEYVEVEPAPRAVREAPTSGNPDVRNLDQIGAALLIHYIRHEKTYPANLAVLVKTEKFAAKFLVSPKDESPKMIGDVKVSYEYIGHDVAKVETEGGKGADASKIVMVWSRTPPRSVTFLNGSTRVLEEEEFQKLLAYTRSMIAAAK